MSHAASEGLAPTTLVKLVNFQPVDSAEFSCLAKLYFPSRLWNDCRLSILGVGIPVAGTSISLLSVRFIMLSGHSCSLDHFITYFPKCMIEA